MGGGGGLYTDQITLIFHRTRQALFDAFQHLAGIAILTIIKYTSMSQVELKKPLDCTRLITGGRSCVCWASAEGASQLLGSQWGDYSSHPGNPSV